MGLPVGRLSASGHLEVLRRRPHKPNSGHALISDMTPPVRTKPPINDAESHGAQAWEKAGDSPPKIHSEPLSVPVLRMEAAK